jgi:hypothetical protein
MEERGSELELKVVESLRQPDISFFLITNFSENKAHFQNVDLET